MTASAPTCLLCGAAGHLAIPRPPRQYLRCQGCRSLWLEPAPTSEELRAYYDAGTFYEGARQAEPRRRVEAAARLRRLRRHAGAAGSLLDVGCGDGLFLEEARAAGWAVEGLEPSVSLAAAARARGLEVTQGASLAALPLGALQVLTAWEVIEHVQDPAAFVAEVAAALRPGGLLGLSTPDGAGLAARLLGRGYPFASSPEHLILYSREALRRLLAGAGLRVVELRSFSGMGLRESAAMLRRRLGLGAALLAPAVTLAFGLLDAIGEGTEVELYAVKEPSLPGADR